MSVFEKTKRAARGSKNLLQIWLQIILIRFVLVRLEAINARVRFLDVNKRLSE